MTIHQHVSRFFLIFLLSISALWQTAVFADEMQVNINTASAEEIAEAVKGIGITKAKAIVEYREQHGTFQSLDELIEVKGIGEKTLEKNRDALTL